MINALILFFELLFNLNHIYLQLITSNYEILLLIKNNTTFQNFLFHVLVLLSFKFPIIHHI